MIVLGLLLILVAVGATVFVVIAPTATSQIIEVPAGAITISTSPLAMFLAGAVSLILLGLGYALISGGTRRKARSRKELRQLRKEQAATGAGTHPEGGHRSSRSDRDQKEPSTETNPEPRADLSNDDSKAANKSANADTNKDANRVGNKDLQGERQPDSEPHAST
ncbi:MAG: hypothetical protein ABIP19_12885 [Dermatophilaceae bacterium]